MMRRAVSSVGGQSARARAQEDLRPDSWLDEFNSLMCSTAPLPGEEGDESLNATGSQVLKAVVCARLLQVDWKNDGQNYE